MAAALLSVVGASTNACALDLIGYLPYYRMNASYNANTLPDQLPLLDEIRYFGLTINSGGAITPLGGSGSLAAHLSRIETIQQAIAALPQDQRPRLAITLGGAGEAAPFATVSASSTLRSTLAQNISAFLDQSGASSIDTDWAYRSQDEDGGTSRRRGQPPRGNEQASRLKALKWHPSPQRSCLPA